MAAFYVRGNGRACLCLSWAKAVEAHRAMSAAGVTGVAIYPLGRLSAEEC